MIPNLWNPQIQKSYWTQELQTSRNRTGIEKSKKRIPKLVLATIVNRKSCPSKSYPPHIYPQIAPRTYPHTTRTYPPHISPRARAPAPMLNTFMERPRQCWTHAGRRKMKETAFSRLGKGREDAVGVQHLFGRSVFCFGNSSDVVVLVCFCLANVCSSNWTNTTSKNMVLHYGIRQ